MSLSLKQLEAEALYLSVEERVDLAQRLFDSVEDEDGVEGSAEVDAAWVREAERRYERHVAGETQPVPAAEAIARVRAQLTSP